jgi:tRNA-specific 2-thiouridylase
MPEKTADHKKVLLGMSGGLDSTMSALLLQRAGYKVIGLTLKTWHHKPEEQTKTISKAIALAKDLNIEHYVTDITKPFKKEVVDYFCKAYLSGKTPNPCNRCNPLIKWPYLIRKAKELGCHNIATGHYAGKVNKNGIWYVKKGADPTKDQSYFLWNLSQPILEKALFPLGDLKKEDVRKLAIKDGLTTTAHQQESMGVCFLGGVSYRDFLSQLEHEGKLQIKTGDIIDEEGQVRGKHRGIPYFTIGQKKGLEMEDKKYFVTQINAGTNQILVSKTAPLETNSLNLSDFQITEPLIKDKKTEVSIRIRGIDKIPEIPGSIKLEEKSLKVEFSKAAWAITPGQSIVFYKNDCIIGGGIV